MALIEQQIQAVCIALLEIALNTLVGAAEIPVPPARAREKNVSEVLQWRTHEMRLRAEIKDYKAASTMPSPPSLDVNIDENYSDETHLKLEESLSGRIAKLQDELFERSSKHQRDELLIRRVIQAPMLLSALSSKHRTEDNKYIKEATKTKDQKIIQIMKRVQKLKEVRGRVEQAKKHSANIQAENSKLYLELQEKTQENTQRSGGGFSAEQSDLDMATLRTKILRHVLKSLILESGVHWARHQGLRTFMLQDDN